MGPGDRAARPLYEEGRKLYTEEINAAARGAFAAGATEVVVMDCHGAGGGWSFNSLIPEELDPRLEFVVQHAVDGVHRALSSRAATQRCSWACTRWPARADGGMNHTVSGTAWRNLWFNGDGGGRDRHQRGAVRYLGLPRAAGDRRRGGLPARAGSCSATA